MYQENDVVSELIMFKNPPFLSLPLLLLSGCAATTVTLHPVTPDMSAVSYTGGSDFSTKVPFFGEDTTFTTAIKNILPKGWTYTLSAPMPTKHVSWDAGAGWMPTLGGVMRHYGFYARLDFKKKHADISRIPIIKQPVTTQSKRIVSPTKTVARPPAKKTLPTQPAPLAKPIQPQPTPTWRIAKGVLLQEGVTLWAQHAQCSSGTWSVRWETDVNYRVDAPLTFSGDFKQALTALFTLYLSADKPLYAITNTPQCLVRITDKGE